MRGRQGAAAERRRAPKLKQTFLRVRASAIKHSARPNASVGGCIILENSRGKWWTFSLLPFSFLDRAEHASSGNGAVWRGVRTRFAADLPVRGQSIDRLRTNAHPPHVPVSGQRY
jgi:hypothetical protein